MKKSFLSLQYKLQWVILLIVVLPLSGIAFVAYHFSAAASSEYIRESKIAAARKTVSAVEILLDEVRNSSLELYQTREVYNYLTTDRRAASGEAALKLSEFLSNHLSFDPNVAEIHIIREDGLYFHSTSVYRNLTQEQKERTDAAKGRLTFVGEAVSQYPISAKAYLFARRIRDVNDFSRDLGYLQICIRQDIFAELLDSNGVDRVGNAVIENGEVIIASEAFMRFLDSRQTQQSLAELAGADPVDWGGEPALLTYDSLNYPGWYLANVSSLSGMSAGDQLKLLLVTLSITCVAFLIISAVLARLFSTLILRRLTVVTDSMKDLEAKEYNLRIPETGNDEITQLAISFNKMSKRIHELLNDVYLFQIRERDAKIKALQAYINPHFLYNTLDTICWMSRMENAYETCDLVEALSQLFRMSIQESGGLHTVRQELKYTSNYLKIQECRYADSVDFQLVVEPGLEEYQTVNFALQPLVENAISHGMEPKGESGVVCIRVYRQADCLIYSVMNDGVVCDPTELNQLIADYSGGKRGMAISGLDSRVKLCWGAEYGLHFDQDENGNLVAIVKQPLRRGDGAC